MKKCVILLMTCSVFISFFSACNLVGNSPDDQLIGVAELADYFCSPDLFCQGLEFQQGGKILFRDTEDVGRYAVIAPGKLKIKVSTDSFVFDYLLQDDTLTLSLDGDSQSYFFSTEAQNESANIELVEEEHVPDIQAQHVPIATQENPEFTFTYLYTLDAIETLEKNAHYRLEMTDGLGSAEMVKQEPIISDLEFSNDGNYLYVAAGDAGMMTWDVASRSVVADLEGRFITIEVTSNGEYIVVDTSQCLLEVRQSSGLVHVADVSGEGCTTLFDVHPYENIVAASGVNGEVLFFDLPNGGLTSVLNTSKQDFYPAMFLADGSLLGSSSGEYAIDVWNYHTGELISNHQLGIQIDSASISFSPTDSVIAFGPDNFDALTHEGAIVLYDLEARTSIELLHDNPSHRIYKTSFSGDGQLVAGSDSKNVYIWDVESGELIFEISQDNGYIGDIAFIPGNRQLAIAYPTWIEIWGEE